MRDVLALGKEKVKLLTMSTIFYFVLAPCVISLMYLYRKLHFKMTFFGEMMKDYKSDL